MKAVITRNSKQKSALLKLIKQGTLDHPTADEVYQAMRKVCPSISMGTVYRNLNQMEESGEIKRLSFTDGPDHYDYNTSTHYHYICRKCGRIYDMPTGVKEAILKAVELVVLAAAQQVKVAMVTLRVM